MKTCREEKKTRKKKQKVGRKKGKKIYGRKKNLGEGRSADSVGWVRRFFLIQKKKKNREEPGEKACGSLEDLGITSGMVSLGISY